MFLKSVSGGIERVLTMRSRQPDHESMCEAEACGMNFGLIRLMLVGMLHNSIAEVLIVLEGLSAGMRAFVGPAALCAKRELHGTHLHSTRWCHGGWILDSS